MLITALFLVRREPRNVVGFQSLAERNSGIQNGNLPILVQRAISRTIPTLFQGVLKLLV